MPINTKVHVFGRPGSDYMKKLRRWMGSPLAASHIAINYGLQGAKLRTKLEDRKFNKLNNIPVINLKQYGNKYECVKGAEDAGVPVPPTVKPRDFMGEDRDGWIQKPYYSLGGRDIERVKNIDDVPRRTHYLQKEIKNRRYELRCIAMAWVKPKDWLFQKRVHEGGEDILAWNHHNGGKFITVENPNEPLFARVRKDMIKLMKKFNYQFGAGDFLIQNPGERGAPLKHYFIEWNLAPGWTMERTEVWYKNNWEKLINFSQEDIENMIEGIFPFENNWGELAPHRPGVAADEVVQDNVGGLFFPEDRREEEDQMLDEIDQVLNENEEVLNRFDRNWAEVEPLLEPNPNVEENMREIICPGCGQPINFIGRVRELTFKCHCGCKFNVEFE